MQVLCKNTVVWEDGKVLHDNLCPTALKVAPLVTWLGKRVALTDTNPEARSMYTTITLVSGVKSVTPADLLVVHALSLSDCYWTREEGDTSRFEDVSPYYNEFWKAHGCTPLPSAPTMYVDGARAKYWLSKDILFKLGDSYEHEACTLMHALGIPCMKTVQHPKGTFVTNLSTPDRMLIQHSTLAHNERLAPLDVCNRFGQRHLYTYIGDIITGNDDRHPGNLANFIDPSTGLDLGPTPAYDFDRAFKVNTPDFAVYLIGLMLPAVDHYNARDYAQDVALRAKAISSNPLVHLYCDVFLRMLRT